MRAEHFQSTENLRIAAEIVDSDPVIGVFAACEWDCLSDDGKEWIAAIVAETRRRFAPQDAAPRKVCHGNVRPAPFAITPHLVARVLDVAGALDPSPRPTAATENKVVGRIEPARVAPVPGAPSVPAETPNLGRPDIPSIKSFSLPPPAKKARKSDTSYRQAKDREARELERPVDRIDMIRAAAARLAQREPGRAPRLPLGAPTARKAPPVVALQAEARQATLREAIAFLKARCILVTVCDRDAVIRKFLVSGKRDPMLASEVIAFAATKGFEVGR